MAAINAYFQFDMMTLNLNKLASGYYDFFDNEYAPYGDTVYEDVFSFNYAQNRYGIFGGSGFAVDFFGRVSGTVQGYLETYGETILFSVENFSYGAAGMLSAIYSKPTADDFSIFRSILARDDTFYLSNSNDRANGYAGADLLAGYAGSDILYGGDGNDRLYGGEGADSLYGDANDDRLYGGSGNDRLVGGSGADRVAFEIRPNSTSNRDTIADFQPRLDRIELENAIFTRLALPGKLSVQNFARNLDGVAKDKNDYIVYETDTGKLFYDADGSGKGKAVLIATLENKAALTAADFYVI